MSLGRYIALFFGLITCIAVAHATMAHVAAAEDFITDYNVTYDIAESGLAHVTQKITLTNQQSGTYAKEYTLTITSVKPKNMKAYTSSSQLSVEQTEEDGKTLVNIPFKDKVIGKDKSFTWTIEYDADSIVGIQGSVKTLLIPRVGIAGGLGNYILNVNVPRSFGTPTAMVPQPANQQSSSQRTIYTFAKDDVVKQGVFAIFGEQQVYHFQASYPLANPSLISVTKEIALPPTTPNQNVAIESITPLPQSVTLDADGNWIAKFTVKRGETLDVKVSGFIALSVKPQYTTRLDDAQRKRYTSSQNYWESDANKIVGLANEIAAASKATSGGNSEEAKAIFQYVIATLAYMEKTTDHSVRNGALKALDNPTNATAIDFADLFVALARASKIPAREVVGVALGNQNSLHLPSEQSMHVWVEYVDSVGQWVPADPAFSAATGGIDYFSHWDVNHIALVLWGDRSDKPIPPGQAQAAANRPFITFTLADKFPQAKPNLKASIHVLSQGFANFPVRAELVIENAGNTALLPTQVSMNSSTFTVLGKNQVLLDTIPPKGTVRLPIVLQSTALFRIGQGFVTVTINNHPYELPVVVSPLGGRFKQVVITSAVGGIAIGLVAYYGLIRRRLAKPAKSKNKKSRI